MALGRLWAPWRASYLTKPRGASRGCIFCHARRSQDDRRTQVVFRGQRVFCVLNRYPYNNGHVMISPYRHIGTISQLTREEVVDLFHTAALIERALRRVLRPHGFNLGANLGRAGGAGIVGHFHLHLVPRWVGDTNFMSTIGQTKVVSQSLEALYRVLTAALPRRHR